MSWVAVAIGGSAALSAGLGYLSSKNKTSVEQVPLETPEQGKARRKLLGFGETGTLGDYVAGEAYGGSLGDFSLSALEERGLGKVEDRLGAGTSAMFRSGEGTIQDFLSTEKYNPLQEGGAYDALRGRIQRNTREASDATRRSAAFGNNLYSTDTIDRLGDVQARGVETEAVTMANLYDNYIGRKASVIPQAFAADAQRETTERNRTADSFAYGGVQRSLNTARDQAAYGEFQRQRGEKRGQLAALGSVAGTPSNFGVPNVTLPNSNPWAEVTGLLAKFGGNYLGTRYAQPTQPVPAGKEKKGNGGWLGNPYSE